MPIRNKDGSPYRLQGPNPLVKVQEVWDLAELVLHNVVWGSETHESNEPLPPPPPPPQDFLSELKDTKPVEVIPEPKLPPPPIKNSMLIWCSPAHIHTVQDELYGQSYRKISYGQKFTFEGVLLERGDLVSRFWTDAEVPVNSVIYPSTYLQSGKRISDCRWWKVAEKLPMKGGWLLNVVPSTYQPDFSD